MQTEMNYEPQKDGANNINAPERNQTWEKNHRTITKAVAQFIRDNEGWPTKAEIAEATGLSWPTVNKHLKNFGAEEFVVEEMVQFKFMSSNVLARLCEFAIDGDIRAMRLSLEVAGILKKVKKA